MTKPYWAPRAYRQGVRGATNGIAWSIALPPRGEPLPVLVQLLRWNRPKVTSTSTEVSLDAPWWARTRLTARLYVVRLIRRGVLK